MNRYDELYFRFITEASIASARILLPFVNQVLRPVSVADFGCGLGAWLKVWKELGVKRVLGVDGDYVQQDSLLIARTEFRSADLTKPVDLLDTFDLVQCLEVGEHLPTAASECLVETLVRHGEVVLFSAAVPGQGGFQHINERPYAYWRDIFLKHKFHLLDMLRPRVIGLNGIEPWYALNTFLFVREDRLQSLPSETRRYLVLDGDPIRDYSPFLFKFRKTVLKHLPVASVNFLHHVKRSLFLAKCNLWRP